MSADRLPGWNLDREMVELLGEIQEGPARVRLIRCTCAPGAWPCMCEREVKPGVRFVPRAEAKEGA